MSEIRETTVGNSYWDETGAYTPELTKLSDELMPPSGSAETLNGELVRAVSRLNYEWCNNGNCNAIDFEEEVVNEFCPECSGSGEVEDWNYDTDEDATDTCDECGGSGEIEDVHIGGGVISPFYYRFIRLIQETLTGSTYDIEPKVIALTSLMTEGYRGYEFDANETMIYSAVIDAVGHYVTNNEDTKVFPKWYEKD